MSQKEMETIIKEDILFLIEAEYSEWLSSRENLEDNYDSLSIENPFLIDED